MCRTDSRLSGVFTRHFFSSRFLIRNLCSVESRTLFTRRLDAFASSTHRLANGSLPRRSVRAVFRCVLVFSGSERVFIQIEARSFERDLLGRALNSFLTMLFMGFVKGRYVCVVWIRNRLVSLCALRIIFLLNFFGIRVRSL